MHEVRDLLEVFGGSFGAFGQYFFCLFLPFFVVQFLFHSIDFLERFVLVLGQLLDLFL